jgi:hypothetical protein
MPARRFPPPWSILKCSTKMLLVRIARKVTKDSWVARQGRLAVKAFLAACVAAVVLAAISLIILNRVQEPADRAFATPPYTRVGD